jgi:putative membrane protein
MRIGITGLLLVLSLTVTVGAYVRWDRAERALRENRPLPIDPLPRLMVIGLSVVTVAAAVLIYLAEAGV